MKRTMTWILIADGTRARIAWNDGPGRGVQFLDRAELRGRNRPGREIMSDRPGRTFDSAGQGRHALELPTDPREHERQVFLNDVAALLDREHQRGRYDRLVLVAPPKALGTLRDALSDAARAKVTGEIDKNLTNIPVHRIAEHLGSVLAV